MFKRNENIVMNNRPLLRPVYLIPDNTPYYRQKMTYFNRVTNVIPFLKRQK